MENNQTTNTTTLELESAKPALDSFASLFKQSWQFFKLHAKSITVFFFLLGFLPAFIQLIFQFLNFKLATSFSSSTVIPFIIIFGLLSFVISIAMQVLYFGAIRKVSDLDQGITDLPLASFKKILAYFWSIVWIILLTTALFIGGTIALIVPAILFAISIAFVGATVAIEEKKGVDAIIQSFWYANSKRWQIFVRSFLMALLIAVIGLLALVVLGSLAIGVLYFVFGGFDAGRDAVVSFILTNAGSEYVPPTNLFYLVATVWYLLGSAVSAPLWGLFTIFSFFLWKNAKAISAPEVPSDFAKSTRRKVVAFAWVGVVIVPIILSLIVFISLKTAKQKALESAEVQKAVMEQIQKELEKETITY